MDEFVSVVEIFILTCEDASHLGGPMGTEYTTHMFSKPFASLESAQRFAEKYSDDHGGLASKEMKWTKDWYRERWAEDASKFIFVIKKDEVLS